MNPVLLINPGGQPAIFQGLAVTATAKEPPIWCRLIASYLRVNHIPVAILDAEALELSPVAVANVALNMGPALIVVVVHGHQPSASTQKMPVVAETVRAIKAVLPEKFVVLVGGHVAALPQQSLAETGADYACVGEGPVTVFELAWAIKHGKPPGVARGLRWASWITSSHAVAAPNVEDLERGMPGGCWDLLPMAEYRSYAHHAWTNDFQRQPYASIYTSLGCPYSCSFCMIQTPFRQGDALVLKGKANSYRTWPVESTIAELEILVEKYGVVNIRFDDEMFVLNEPHVSAICAAITERWGDQLNLWCYGRVDQTKEKFLDGMRRAGFKWLALGIESMSTAVRDGVDKGGYGVVDIIATVNRVKNHGINIIANYMFGLPDDTPESMRQTLDLALELNTEYVNMYAAVAYPGSQLWDEQIKAGWRPPKNWLAWSFYSYEHEPLGTNTLTPTEVLRFRDTAWQEYMRDESYLRMISLKFGRRAVEEVLATAAVPIRRKLIEGGEE